MDFKANDQVIVSIPQLHTRASLLEKGEVISIEGNHAQVQLQGEDIPRTVPVDRLAPAEAVFGSGMTGRPNELPVIDAIRR